MAAELNIYYIGSEVHAYGGTKEFLVTVTADNSTSANAAGLNISISGNTTPLNLDTSVSFSAGTCTPLGIAWVNSFSASGSFDIKVTLTYSGTTISKTKSVQVTDYDAEVGLYIKGDWQILPNQRITLGTSATVYFDDTSDTRTYDLMCSAMWIYYPTGNSYSKYYSLSNMVTLDTNLSRESNPDYEVGEAHYIADVYFDPGIIGPRIPTSTTYNADALWLVAKQGNEIVSLRRVKNSPKFDLPSSAVPKIDSINPTDDKGYRNTYGVYVGTKSILRVGTSCSGIYGSTITKIEHTIDELAVSTTDPSIAKLIGVLNQSGSRILKTIITDSRGRTATRNTTITVAAYVAPTLTFQANRWDTVNNQENDGSNIVRLDGEGTVPNINGKAVAGNKLQFKWRLKGNTAWTTAATFTFTGPNVTKIQNVSNQSVDNQYEYQAILTDAFGVTVTSESSVGKAKPVLEFNASGLGMGIGTVAPETGLDVGMQTNFKGTAEDGYSRIQITDPDGSESVILANLSGSTLQLLVNALGSYDKALVGSHIFMQNNKSIGGLTTSGAQTPILKMNTSNLLEFTWPSGGVRGRVGKQIWEGTASPGSTITVPELPYYNIFVIYDGGSRGGIAVRTTFGAASWIWGLTHEPQTNNIWLKAFGALVNPDDPTKLEVTFFVHTDLKNNYFSNAEPLRGIRGLL